MHKFVSSIEKDRSGYEWSPLIKVACPACKRIIAFYTNLNGNKCKYCWEVLPFKARMAKDQKLRVEYHVDI